MILQKLLFPNVKTCGREKMYYAGDDINIFADKQYCAIPKGNSLKASTYFNSFSIAKWNKYTMLDNLSLRLELKGAFIIEVYHAFKMNNGIKERLIANESVTTKEKESITMSLPVGEQYGIYYFVLKAVDKNAEYWGGAYETEISEEKLNPVKIAIDICTFRREKYVTHNVNTLRETIIENKESPLYKNLEIFISDNGKSLGDSLNSEEVHVFPNRNLGGAGGFGRGMVEIHKVAEERGITHILMMDDDVRLNPDSLVRTYTMLRMIKPEHKGAFIGGHMLKIDAQNIQSEAADHWDMVSHHPIKYNYNLENFNLLLKNEIEESVNHFGWWYCCMPVNVVSDTNLPLPIFIKRDDIEYGLRNGKEFITLNGICVWHEPFEYKYATYLEYYYFRNMCIINSRHRLSFSEKRLIKEVRKRILIFLLRYRYKDAELSLLGIQHYLKGIDWFKKLDGEKINSEIMKLGYKKQPLDELDYVFIHGVYENNLVVNEGLKRKLVRYMTLNGLLLPARKNVVVPAYQPSIALFYRAAKVLNYEEISNTAFITTRDRKAFRTIWKMYRQTVKMIHKNYKKVTLEYRDRYDELINLKFWNEYLFHPGEVPKIESRLDKMMRPRNTKKQFVKMIASWGMRTLQRLLFWLPVKKKRVMVTINDRKGFTCNPKYIVKKLVELYGDKLEIIWATAHPETCQEIEDLGVEVVRSNSIKQMRYYFRTKFFITNDNFPAWALHRPNQKWMNTWHAGMNYKHIGYDYLAPMSSLAARSFKLVNRQPDFYLSGSGFFTEDTAKSFRLKEKIFLPTGLPRNDVFFGEQEEIVKKVYQTYHIERNVHLAIFAPTFRRGMKSATYGMDFDQVRDALRQRFGGEWIILFRNHNFVKGKQKYAGAVDVSSYHDMQELMCAADVLISDYSSCLYDFCLTHKPAFVYATDLEYYQNGDRAFAYPFEKWPYPVARDNKELIQEITNFDTDSYAKKVEEHLKDAEAYDNGTASKQVAELIKKYCL